MRWRLLERLPSKAKLHEVIFEADTPAGKWFDVALLIAILASVVVVMLETIPPIREKYGVLLYIIEWILTALFTVEYLLRIYCLKRPVEYVTSFFGIVDFLAILPTYLSIIFVGSQSLVVIRTLRLLRVFRIFRLVQYMRQGRMILLALRRSAPKLTVFIIFVLILVTIAGALMYLVEGGVNPKFDSIPRSVYWAIVTITTVGFGDISPMTELGQLIAACLMILGYSVIAVPTGIVSVEMSRQPETFTSTEACRSCGGEGHADDAEYCRFCGAKMEH